MAATRMLFSTIRRKFPNVHQLQTETLGKWLSDSNSKAKMLVIDVREKAEQGISSIEGTVKINPNDGTKEVLEKLQDPEIKTVVAFCSLGYRSSTLINNLIDDLKKQNRAGNVDLYSLEGGIFKWANENRPLVDKIGNETTFVHPFNSVFGKFVESEKRKFPE